MIPLFNVFHLNYGRVLLAFNRSSNFNAGVRIQLVGQNNCETKQMVSLHEYNLYSCCVTLCCSTLI
jgi:hypothetical protein